MAPRPPTDTQLIRLFLVLGVLTLVLGLVLKGLFGLPVVLSAEWLEMATK